MASDLTNQEYYEMAAVVYEISQRNQQRCRNSEAAREYADRYPQRVRVIIFLVCHIARHILKNTLLITNQARTRTHARLNDRSFKSFKGPVAHFGFEKKLVFTRTANVPFLAHIRK